MWCVVLCCRVGWDVVLCRDGVGCVLVGCVVVCGGV